MSIGRNSEEQTIHDIMREIEAKSAKGVYIFRGEGNILGISQYRHLRTLTSSTPIALSSTPKNMSITED